MSQRNGDLFKGFCGWKSVDRWLFSVNAGGVFSCVNECLLKTCFTVYKLDRGGGGGGEG